MLPQPCLLCERPSKPCKRLKSVYQSGNGGHRGDGCGRGLEKGRFSQSIRSTVRGFSLKEYVIVVCQIFTLTSSLSRGRFGLLRPLPLPSTGAPASTPARLCFSTIVRADVLRVLVLALDVRSALSVGLSLALVCIMPLSLLVFVSASVVLSTQL